MVVVNTIDVDMITVVDEKAVVVESDRELVVVVVRDDVVCEVEATELDVLDVLELLLVLVCVPFPLGPPSWDEIPESEVVVVAACDGMTAKEKWNIISPASPTTMTTGIAAKATGIIVSRLLFKSKDLDYTCRAGI